MCPIWPAPHSDRYIELKAIRVGAVTAHNLIARNSSSRGREKVLRVLRFLPRNARILFVFGEIDCRAHILKHASSANNSELDRAIRNTVERYVSFLREIQGEGFRLAVWGPIASSSKVISGVRFSTVGSEEERNKVTKRFNEILMKSCEESSVVFVSIFSELVSENEKTNSYYYMDDIHLAQTAMPLAETALIENGCLKDRLSVPKSCIERTCVLIERCWEEFKYLPFRILHSVQSLRKSKRVLCD